VVVERLVGLQVEQEEVQLVATVAVGTWRCASTQEEPKCWAALPLTSQGVVTADWEVEADMASDSVCQRLCTTVQVVGGGILVAQHSLIICRVNGHLQRKIICVLAAEVLAEGRASLLASSSSISKEFARETGNLS
jgi:hypothetical protein